MVRVDTFQAKVLDLIKTQKFSSFSELYSAVTKKIGKPLTPGQEGAVSKIIRGEEKRQGKTLIPRYGKVRPRIEPKVAEPKVIKPEAKAEDKLVKYGDKLVQYGYQNGDTFVPISLHRDPQVRGRIYTITKISESSILLKSPDAPDIDVSPEEFEKEIEDGDLLPFDPKITEFKTDDDIVILVTENTKEIGGSKGKIASIDTKAKLIEIKLEKPIEIGGDKVETVHIPETQSKSLRRIKEIRITPPPKLTEVDAAIIIFTTMTPTDWLRGDTERIIYIKDEPSIEDWTVEKIQIGKGEAGEIKLCIITAKEKVKRTYKIGEKGTVLLRIENYVGNVINIEEIGTKKAKELQNEIEKEREERQYKKADVVVGFYQEIDGRKELIGINPDLSVERTEVIV